MILAVEDLTVTYPGGLAALRGVSLGVAKGEVLGIVGESGCGKSTLAAAMMNLLPYGARIEGGAVRLDGQDTATLPPAAQRQLRGSRMAMVFQDPMTAFNPVLTIGAQLSDYTRVTDRTRLTAALQEVGIPDPARCLTRFPHELSGGMRQRVAIAAALLVEPDVLIADEPTTALDATMEAQILHLFRGLKGRLGGALVIVTHHLGVIAALCDRVAVMYAGQVVEEGPVDAIFHDARHPYTQALLSCDPAVVDPGTGRLPAIGGSLPDLSALPPGCAFASRCPRALAVCATPPPRIGIGPGRTALCHRVAA